MKIAYVHCDPELPVLGWTGSSVHVQEVVAAMLRRGAEVHLFTLNPGEGVLETRGLMVHRLPPLPVGNSLARERAALDSNHHLRAALALAAEEAPFDFIYERQSLWSYAAMEFALEHQVPSVLEVNAPLIDEHANRRALLNRSGAEEATMRAYRAAKLITPVSRQLARIIEMHPSALGRIHVVPNAVDAARFQDAEPFLPHESHFTVGFSGMLKATQGLNSLIESFSQVAEMLPTARLLIVGDGPDREHLEREIASRELTSRVILTGPAAPEHMPAMLASMNVAVAPYPALTPFYHSPIKVYEFMAAGLPIVASRIGQIEEIIQHGETGLLIRPGDANALTLALCELAGDVQLRDRLGHAAREAVSNHTWDDLVAYVISLLGLAPAHSPVSEAVPAALSA